MTQRSWNCPRCWNPDSFTGWICLSCGYHSTSLLYKGEIVEGQEKTEGPTPTKYEVSGGSTRSERAPAYHLVPREGPRRIAQRFGMGAEIHGENNWKKSIQANPDSAYAFCKEAYNHMVEHQSKMLNGDFTDDHLGAIGWAVCVLAYAEGHWNMRWTALPGFEAMGILSKKDSDCRVSRVDNDPLRNVAYPTGGQSRS